MRVTLVHPLSQNPFLWTSSCVCVHGDGVFCGTFCRVVRERQCKVYGGLVGTYIHTYVQRETHKNPNVKLSVESTEHYHINRNKPRTERTQ